MPSGAILAGGGARRFEGRDKSALSVDGRSILEWQVEALSQVTDDILIVGRERHWQPAVLPHPVRSLPDRVPGLGPLGGLDAALAEAREEVVVVVACDMPFISAPLLGHLAGLASEGDAVVPCTEEGYHPLCAAYRRACRTAVSRHLAEGRLAMRDLLNDLTVRVVPLTELRAFGSPARLLANVNTATEYAKLAGDGSHEPLI